MPIGARRRSGRRHLRTRRARRARHARRLGRDGHRPGDALDVETVDGEPVDGPVALFEALPQHPAVLTGERPVVECDAKVVALSDVPELDEPGGGQGRVRRRPAPHDARRFRVHLVEHRVDGAGVEVAKVDRPRTHHLECDRREQEPDRGPHPGPLRDHHPIDSELLGEPSRVQRGPAPERDQGMAPDDPSPLDGVDPGRVGHVLVHHLDDPDRGPPAGEPEPIADVPPEGVLGAIGFEPDLPAREPLRVELAEDEVRVRHRRPRAAPPVARGAGLGAGARRPHPEPVHLVDARDGAAARADLHHLDDRDAYRQAASLEVPVPAGHLEGPGTLRGAVLDEADLRRGAAHVEGERFGQPALAGHVSGEDRAPGGTRLHQPDGKPGRVLDRGHPPARHHQ